jgi:ubiquinone/menaquinone biosynthesis C-methylase UbiE
MHRLAAIAMILLAACGAGEKEQRQSIEEWERETFEKQPPERVMDVAGIEPGMVVGEVGAGRGRFTMYLARRVGPEGKVFANDIDADGLEYLRERCERAGISNVETVLGESDDPRFPVASLDMAFMVWTYHWFDQPVAMLRSIKQALKPGATVVLVEPDPVRGPGGPDHGVSEERLRREAGESGFELILVDDFLAEDLIFVLRVRAEAQ